MNTRATIESLKITRIRGFGFAHVIAIAILFASGISSAAQPMKCVDGTGRVVFTELSSCADALRALPPVETPTPSSTPAKSENYRRERPQENASQSYERRMQAEYETRKRLQEEDARQQKACAMKKIEVDRQMADADAHQYDSWWRNRAVATAREWEVECAE